MEWYNNKQLYSRHVHEWVGERYTESDVRVESTSVRAEPNKQIRHEQSRNESNLSTKDEILME